MDNALGDFLRARRELITPAEAGLAPGHGMRRVPGLRREEVAMLAGISIDYYLRLERGRDRSPSARVVEALAHVLRLDAESTGYLLTLAGRAAPAEIPADTRMPRNLGLFVRTVNVPCIVFNKYCDVLAANALATALVPFLSPGANLLRGIFVGAQDRVRLPDAEQLATGAVAHLRAQCGADTDDPRLHALVGELSLKSARFRQLWERHEVMKGRSSTLVIRHPHVGDVELMAEKFTVGGVPGLEAMLLHAEPGSRSAEALTALTVRTGR
ncbi:helix-turn-helix domain-containing protein [Catenuloplanes japonicus]|uniref:helix-turn-helix domain-containing protein n=1 Tax=Catenuloplanes japonicus TaxID=33876 RepID=UPI000526703A|nr:helix-turn-helix transcriptional regulator [Catenuloplanes japonicus]